MTVNEGVIRIEFVKGDGVMRACRVCRAAPKKPMMLVRDITATFNGLPGTCVYLCQGCVTHGWNSVAASERAFRARMKASGL